MPALAWHPDDDGDLVATTSTHELFVFTPPPETVDAQGGSISWGVDNRSTGDVVASGIAASIEVAKRSAEAALMRAGVPDEFAQVCGPAIARVANDHRKNNAAILVGQQTPPGMPTGFTAADGELALSILWQLVGVDWPGGRFAKIEGPWLKLREARFHASSPELGLLERLATPS